MQAMRKSNYPQGGIPVSTASLRDLIRAITKVSEMLTAWELNEATPERSE